MQIYERCEYLTNEIGYRWIGSVGEKRAENWVEGLLRKTGDGQVFYRI
jgi:hypothetical protein